jgi:hypothetical protein
MTRAELVLAALNSYDELVSRCQLAEARGVCSPGYVAKLSVAWKKSLQTMAGPELVDPEAKRLLAGLIATVKGPLDDEALISWLHTFPSTITDCLEPPY